MRVRRAIGGAGGAGGAGASAGIDRPSAAWASSARTGTAVVGAHSRVRYEIELPAGVSGELMTPDGGVRELRGGRTVEVCAAADTAPAL